jgi:hypothetical protein
MVRVYVIWVKTAWRVWAEFIVTVVGLEEPASTPSRCQWLKYHPDAGVAVT